MRRNLVGVFVLFSLLSAAVLLSRADEEAKPAKIDVSQLPTALDRKIDFVADIQPLLKSRCYSCHGAEEQESGLRLDNKKRAFEGGDNGRILKPKNVAESRLLHMVAGLDKETGIMPPEGEGTPLSRNQVALIRSWIDQGAVWPDAADTSLASKHWSFQPIKRPVPPRVSNQAWVRNPLDQFVAAGHEAIKIKPSDVADRATLIRRIYLDLVGLPPKVEEVNQFLADERPQAYEEMVDRVLKSKHFGERWGRHWLDLARYADSDGYEKDRPRPWAWQYRDWVINALNENKSFDQFTIEQIAGDMLPKASLAQRTATGFHRNTLHNTEGGTDREEDRVKKTVDRTNTVSTIWLGLTIGCAQCHSHKYDPITQREYYQTYAFFNNINESDIDAPTPTEAAAFAKAKTTWDQEQAKFKAAVDEYTKAKLLSAQADWEKSALTATSVWQTIDAQNLVSSKGATLAKQNDGSVLASGKNEVSDIYTIEAVVPAGVTAIRLEVLPDKSLVASGPGRATNGNFVLRAIRATADDKPVEFKSARADFSQTEWAVANTIDPGTKNGWAVSPNFGKRHVAVFETKSPVAGTKLVVTLDQTYTSNAHNIGRFRLAVTTSSGAIELDGPPQLVVAALKTAAANRTKQQTDEIAKYYRTIDAELKSLNDAVATHAKKAPKTSGKKAQTIAEGGVRQANIHIRGDFLNKGDPVEAVSLSVLPSIKKRSEKPDRLDFAHWLVSKQNPLTARVTVNRIWERYFGRGIVATIDDFGSQGEQPSHAELLDWLASELQDSGWNLKHIHKLILMSATYRQSSAMRMDLEDVDPTNELIARQTRQRVEAEIVRDLALAVSGLLDPKVGGPSVRPPQPAEYSRLTYANSAKWAESQGGDRYRRGLYTFFQRTSPYPMLMTFDAPDSNTCTAARATSNTPLQALTLLNDRVFWECAQSLGRRIMKEVGPSKNAKTARAIHAFQLCVARKPDADELQAIQELFDEQVELCMADDERTTKIVGAAAIPEGVSKTELAGWIAVGRALINLDEFITRE